MKTYLAGDSYVPGFAYFLPTIPEVIVYSTRPTISSEMDKYFKYMMFYSNSNGFSGVNGWSYGSASAGGLSGGGSTPTGSNFNGQFNQFIFINFPMSKPKFNL
ncbi:MAG: hypothetical protein EAZ35_03885 [Sphingobacteriia bacterium]|nr:MAG: hypothetical protein EAZ35_03885 [Sphingobacteriia bacterium]